MVWGFWFVVRGLLWTAWGYMGPSWGYLGLCWPILGLCWRILRGIWAHLRAMLAHLGAMLAHLGPILGLSWPILGLCWPILRPMLAHVDPSSATNSEKCEKMGTAKNTVKRRGFWLPPVVGGRGLVQRLSCLEKRERLRQGACKPPKPWPRSTETPWN